MLRTTRTAHKARAAILWKMSVKYYDAKRTKCNKQQISTKRKSGKRWKKHGRKQQNQRQIRGAIDQTETWLLICSAEVSAGKRIFRKKKKEKKEGKKKEGKKRRKKNKKKNTAARQ